MASGKVEVGQHGISRRNHSYHLFGRHRANRCLLCDNPAQAFPEQYWTFSHFAQLRSGFGSNEAVNMFQVSKVKQ